jgi:hypothetical protein
MGLIADLTLTKLMQHQRMLNKKTMNSKTLFLVAICASVFKGFAFENTASGGTGGNLGLPPGVPRTVDTNGNVIFVDSKFTSQAFEEEGLRLVIIEANKVVSELNLTESVPITVSNLTHAYIGSFGYIYKAKSFGNITTTNFWYGIRKDYKFSDLTVDQYDKRFADYSSKKYLLPMSQWDTNAAYRQATQWLAAVHMDVDGLNRDCTFQVSLSSNMKGVKSLRGKFSPIYFVWWTPKGERDKPGRGAYVELYLPTKTLLQLCVDDSKYILRPPVALTNLAALFPGKASIITNAPVEVQIMEAPPVFTPNWEKILPHK